jgi:hypothetical protein
LSDDFIAINDKQKRYAICFYVQLKRKERELTSGETERECVRGRASEEREIASIQRSTD